MFKDLILIIGFSEKSNPEVISYLEEENTYTDQVTEHLSDARSSIYDEMLARINENDISVPVESDDSGTIVEQKKESPLFHKLQKDRFSRCRRRSSSDQNELAKDTE